MTQVAFKGAGRLSSGESRDLIFRGSRGEQLDALGDGRLGGERKKIPVHLDKGFFQDTHGIWFRFLFGMFRLFLTERTSVLFLVVLVLKVLLEDVFQSGGLRAEGCSAATSTTKGLPEKMLDGTVAGQIVLGTALESTIGFLALKSHWKSSHVIFKVCKFTSLTLCWYDFFFFKILT